MRTLLREIRFTSRLLRKNPGFALTTIATLGLGIGATTAIFSLVNAVVLRPLPFPAQDRLVWIQQAVVAPGVPANTGDAFSYPNFFDWRSQTHTLARMAAYRHSNVTLTGNGDPLHLESQIVSAGFFRVLGIHPALGRDFLPSEEKAGARVAVLSDHLWRTAFGSARDLIGRAITLDGHSYTVVAVMPPGFSFPIENPRPELWTSLADDAAVDSPKDMPLTAQRGASMLRVVGRLKPGVTVAQARAELSAIARQLAPRYPDTNKAYTAALVTPELEHLVGDFRPALRLLFAAVLLVLLIACANVAGLLLARAARRRSEMALRAALGAGQAGIIRQVLVESVFLSLCGGALGVVLSGWTFEALLRFVPANLPRAGQVSIDGAVLAFVTLISVGTGLLFGLLPAWRMSRLDPALALRDGGRSVIAGRAQHRVHHWLVVAETALGLVLLIGSGLLIRSFVRVLRVDPGFDPRHVLTASLNLPDIQYPLQKKAQFYNRLLARLAALPGVQSAAAAFPLPLSNSNIGIGFQIEGRPVPPGDQPSESVGIVTQDFFRTMRIPVLAGRAFTVRDDAKATPVVIVNERFARKYFPGENPIGKRLKPGLGDGTLDEPVREIVGVAGNVKRQGLTADVEPQYYLPYAQATLLSPTLCIRAAGDPAALVGAVRAELAGMDRNIPLYRVSTMDEAFSSAAAQPRFHTMLLSFFAAMALLLSAVGLYAVLSYTVAQRSGEIGVRMALGAPRSGVVRMIVSRGLALALAGIAIGMVASAVLSRFLSGMLYGIQPLDPLTYAAVAALLLLVSVLASGAPAWRASRLNPVETLRDQ